MPWKIERREGRFCVIKEDDGENEGCHDSRDEAEAQMRALYASENRAEERLPIEMRSASVGEVKPSERLIEVVAVPYEQEAVVEYRGELWTESFARGAFTGIEMRSKPIKAYRDHDPAGGAKSGLVGKAVALDPEHRDGLVGTVKIAETPLGDETLALARQGVLGVSVGFGVRGRDQSLDRVTHRRRIQRAFLDHLAFPDNGAYEGAQVISVRGKRQKAEDLPRLDTPLLDDVVSWMESRRQGA